MANKHLLHKNRLMDFEAWLVENGWQLQEPKGKYEVVRAVNKSFQNVPLIVYTRQDSPEHYSVSDSNAKIIEMFLNGEMFQTGYSVKEKNYLIGYIAPNDRVMSAIISATNQKEAIYKMNQKTGNSLLYSIIAITLLED